MSAMNFLIVLAVSTLVALFSVACASAQNEGHPYGQSELKAQEQTYKQEVAQEEAKYNLQPSEHRDAFRSALFHLGVNYVAQERYAQAEPLLDRAVELDNPDTNDSSTLTFLGYAYLKTGDLPEAEQAYSWALRIEEKLQQDSQGKLDKNYLCVSLSGLGSVYMAEKRYAEAEKLLRRSVDLASSGQVAPPNKISAYADLASLLAKTGKGSEADALFKQALDVNPGPFGAKSMADARQSYEKFLQDRTATNQASKKPASE